MKTENKTDPIWQNRNAFESRQSRTTKDFNMIMFSIEDVYFSDVIYIETMEQFVKYYLNIYQYIVVTLSAIILIFLLLLLICVIRTVLLNPILELTRVI